jgi:hypothetical protein
MTQLMQWLHKHNFWAYLLAFLLMILPPVGLYVAAQAGATGWIWALLAMIVLGNALVLLIRP